MDVSITPKTLLCSKTGETDLGFSARLAQRDLPACHHLVKIRVRVRFRIRVSAFCFTYIMLVRYFDFDFDLISRRKGRHTTITTDYSSSLRGEVARSISGGFEGSRVRGGVGGGRCVCVC